MHISLPEGLAALAGALWCSFLALHMLSHEESGGRRLLLKVFARWLEVPLLWIIWMACDGPLRFLTRIGPLRRLLGVLVTRPFALWIDTGVPVPAKDLARLLDRLDGPVAVGPCRCLVAKKTCDHDPRRDIVFRTGAEAFTWAFPDEYEAIGKEEALAIINRCADRGMIAMVFIHCSTAGGVNEYAICNCCRCGCKIYLLNRTVGQKYFPLRDGGFRTEHDPAKCERCGECVDLCPFGAIELTDEGIRVSDCFGCGLCERFCRQGAYTVRQTLPGPPWAQPAWRLLLEEKAGD